MKKLCQNRKEWSNRSTNNGDMDEKAKRPVLHLSNYREAELPKITAILQQY